MTKNWGDTCPRCPPGSYAYVTVYNPISCEEHWEYEYFQGFSQQYIQAGRHWVALTAIAHTQTFEAELGLLALYNRAIEATSSEGASLTSLSSKLTRAWTSVEGGRKKGAHKQKGARKNRRGAQRTL